MTPPRAVLAIVLFLAGGVAVAGAGPAAAASAAPSSSPNGGAFGNLEVWLDYALPPGAAAGSTITVGLTLWDSQQANFLVMSGLYVKLHPATGKARPTEAELTRSDVPGHFAADVIVPKGGPGKVEVVVRDQTDVPIRVGGVGPPPAAPLSSLVTAQIQLLSGSAIAGQPIDVAVDVRPIVDWVPPVSLPDRLVVIATRGRGPDLANAEIRLASGSTTTFAGSITIQEAGDVTLVIGIPGGTSGADEFIESATTRLRVGTPEPSGAPAATAPVADAGPAWPLIGGVLAVVVAAGFVIRRVFADL